MSAALLLLGAASIALAPQDASVDRSPAELTFLDVSAERDSLYVHEVLRVRLRFGFERSFLEQHLIQPFQRLLDVPVQLHAPWLEGLSCARPLPERAAPTSGSSFVLEQEVARARHADDVSRDGRTFAVFELERSFLPTCAGALVLSAPHLRFAYATSFDEDALGERVPVDRHDEVVSGIALTLQILPLPEESRPEGFSGAVGRFTLHAEASPQELFVGESLRLTLHIEGEGDLEHFDPPRLDALQGFRLRGWFEQSDAARRSVTYDLAPLSERVLAVPTVTFPFFDPGPPGAYRTASSAPLPLTVRARPAARRGAGAAAGPGEVGPGAVPAEAGGGGLRSLAHRVLVAVLIALPLAALVWWCRRSRPRAAPPLDPARARAVMAEVRERASAPGVDLAQILTEYLAGRLGCSAPAVIGPGLSARLVAAGVGDEPAARASALLEELVSARFGGSAPSQALERVCALVEELEASFEGVRPRR